MTAYQFLGNYPYERGPLVMQWAKGLKEILVSHPTNPRFGDRVRDQCVIEFAISIVDSIKQEMADLQSTVSAHNVIGAFEAQCNDIFDMDMSDVSNIAEYRTSQTMWCARNPIKTADYFKFTGATRISFIERMSEIRRKILRHLLDVEHDLMMKVANCEPTDSAT